MLDLGPPSIEVIPSGSELKPSLPPLPAVGTVSTGLAVRKPGFVSWPPFSPV